MSDFRRRLMCKKNESELPLGYTKLNCLESTGTQLINTNKISVIKRKDKIDYKSIYMVWNKNIIHNKNKMEFKNYALNMSKR